MSVGSLSALEHRGVDPKNPDEYAPKFEVLMTIKVSDLVALGLRVVRRPTQDCPGHCNVLGMNKSKRKPVHRCAEFLRCPEDVVKATYPTNTS